MMRVMERMWGGVVVLFVLLLFGSECAAQIDQLGFRGLAHLEPELSVEFFPSLPLSFDTQSGPNRLPDSGCRIVQWSASAKRQVQC
jgi:hypothetical protein